MCKVLILCQGVQTMAMGAGPAHAVYFAVYEQVKYLGETSLPSLPDMAVHAGAAVSATIFHDGVMAPADGETSTSHEGQQGVKMINYFIKFSRNALCLQYSFLHLELSR